MQNKSDRITEVIIGEVRGHARQAKYLHGYSKGATEISFINISNGTGAEEMRSAVIQMPGDLPLGTRFKITIEQIDDVTPAVIHRGALPIIEDNKTLVAENITEAKPGSRITEV